MVFLDFVLLSYFQKKKKVTLRYRNRESEKIFHVFHAGEKILLLLFFVVHTILYIGNALGSDKILKIT